MTDSHVVVCFGLYELAPYASGIQEFAVSAP
ncbi:MAG: RsiV family protein [Limnochordia bacterium]|nr:RsiV family protein [Bacillota bacterium]